MLKPCQSEKLMGFSWDVNGFDGILMGFSMFCIFFVMGFSWIFNGILMGFSLIFNGNFMDFMGFE